MKRTAGMGAAAARSMRRRAARPSVLPDDKPISIARIARSITSLTAFGALFSTILFAGRVLVVARFDPDVAAALLINTSLTVVIQAIIMQLFPFLSYIGGLAAIYIGAYRLSERPRRQGVALLLTIAGVPFILPVALSLSDIFVTVIVGVATPVGAFIFGWMRRSIGDLVLMFAIPLAFLTLTSVGALVAGTWIAPETAKVGGATETVIYTLASDGSDLVVFSPGDHAVIRLPASSVTDRQYCRNQSESPTLADRLFNPPIIPKCPTPQKIGRS
ncbi:hypothetical protein OG394_22560 [Kribbella sp. NBC_01245]|uniref:hypothetical protein n=1 Tax=Kribbella sp. NBC_01245 TaxID=2903578 RepID=UPI002E2AF679|nr:hypothetical protein [Kribbella sp. NBC_01245]